MSKYSQEFKLEAVNYYLSGHAGKRATAKRFGVDHTMVRKWVDVYNHFGAQALKPKEKHNQYSAEFKYKVVQAVHQQGLSQRQAAIKFGGLEPSTIHNWLHLHAQGGIKSLQANPRGRSPQMKKPSKFNKKPDSQKTQEELLEELEYLRAEVAYLKKLDALIQEEQIQDKKHESSQD